MIPFLYQPFVIFMENIDFQKLDPSTIQYTLYKIIVLCDSNKKETDFVEYCEVKYSKNQTIAECCKEINANTNILFCKNITPNMLCDLNNIFLEEKLHVIYNERIFEKSFKLPCYWCCKAFIIHEIYNELSSYEFEKCELLLCGQDVAIHSSEKQLLPVNNNNVVTSNKSQRKKCNKYQEIIHIVFATYDRTKNMEPVCESIINQSFKKFHLHILDNNLDPENHDAINKIIEKYSDVIQISLHRYNVNYHCIARIYIIQNLLKQTHMDYFILFDDDQLHHETWIEELINQKTPLSITSWYGKVFDKCDYWNKKANVNKILIYEDLEFKRKKQITQFKYFGPGGCIFDVNLFLFYELFDFLKYSPHIFMIDDLWMSFIFDKFLNIPFYRMLYHPKECIDRWNRSKMTWHGLKDQKADLMKYFSNNFDWDVLKEQRKIITVNSVFNCVYVLYNDDASLKKMKIQMKKMNICACFVYYTNKYNTIMEIFERSLDFERILLLDETVIFHKFFHHYFDKIMHNLVNNWNILYFDGKNINEENHILLNEDISLPNAVGYSINAIESLLSFHLNNRNMLIENKLIEKTSIKNQYVLGHSLINSNILHGLHNNDYDFNNFINIHVNVFVTQNDNIPKFNYINYSILHIDHLHNNEPFVIINNENNYYFDYDILGNGLCLLFREKQYKSKYKIISDVDRINYELWCNYTKENTSQSFPCNYIGFYKINENIDNAKSQIDFTNNDNHHFIF